MNPVVAELTKWLGTGEGLEYVRSLAAGIVWESGHRGALAIHLDQRFGGGSEESREEIAQEFHLFLLETFLPKLDDNPDLINALASGQTGKVFSMARQRFIWYLQDRARRKDTNPRAYLHRRIREMVGRDERFAAGRDGQGRMAFGLAGHAMDANVPVADFSRTDYATWPAPPEPPGREGMFKDAYLARAAQFFLAQVKGHGLGAGPVPVRELVRYLSAHIDGLSMPRMEPLADGDNGPAAPEREMEERCDTIVALGSIGVMARQFTRTMSDAEKRIFCWRLADPPLPFARIAVRLGLADHNQAYRIHGKTRAALARFCANWPGPPLAELPDEVGLAFLEEIRRECEKSPLLTVQER